jgi:parallel beta-helix repeat protein
MKTTKKIAKAQLLEGLEDRRLMAVFNVSTAADNLGNEPIVSGSLREAITLANSTPGADTIHFTIPQASSAKLELKQALPAITESLAIEGATLPGYLFSKRFEIARSNLNFGNYNALEARAPVTIRGLAIYSAFNTVGGTGMGNGLYLNTGSDGSTIEYNFIGLTNAGAAGSGNQRGLMIASSNNVIRNNIVSGNTAAGVAITGSNNVVAGNFIGTDPTGNQARGNGQQGVLFLAGAANNTIGGPTTADRNVISGSSTGVSFDSGNDSTILGNVVEGNYIGLNAGGVSIIANLNGIAVQGGRNSVIKNNVIAGSTFSGIIFGNNKPRNTTITGNRIGMNADGSAALPNTDYAINIAAGCDGVEIGALGAGNWMIGTGGAAKSIVNLADSSGNTGVNNVNFRGNVFGILPNGSLGGSTGFAFNAGAAVGDMIIDGNKFAGQTDTMIKHSETGGHVISNNWFGLSLDGTSGLGTTAVAVNFHEAATINGNKFARANVLLQLGSATTVSNNTFGLTADGIFAVGGTSTGLWAQGSGSYSGNTFGGVTTAMAVSGDPTITNNKFGLDVTGLSSSPITNGIIVSDTATVGGVGNGNLFGAVSGVAIQISDSGNVVIQGNTIGQNLDGSSTYTGQYGIRGSALSNPLIGGTTPGAGNIILGRQFAIDLDNTGFTIQGNTIGLPSRPNNIGIRLENVSAGTIGGDVAGAANTIANNNGRAIVLGANTSSVTIRRNSIHNNGGLAIDLKNDNAVTANDPLDVDAGVQNFPLLLSADSTAGNATSVMGLINTSASTPLVIDFYAADMANNEARTWLGSKTILTDNAGGATFTHNLPFVFGNKYIVATATNIAAFPAGSTSELSPSVQVVGPVDTIAPTVSGSAFEFVSAQKVQLVFSEDLSSPSIAANDLTMLNTTTGQAITPSSVNYDPATRTARFGFASVLPDGNYTFTLAGNRVTDLAGNGNTAFSGTTFVLAGDTNRDRTVNFDDLLTLAQNYGGSNKSFSQGDSNYDGVVNFDDLLMLAQRYGTTLFAAQPIVGAKKSRDVFSIDLVV